MERLHASAVAIGQKGLLILGASGSGKSSLALELMSRGATLIADDQTEIFLRDQALWARAPETLEGLIEARGIGILRALSAPARLVAVVDLDRAEPQRLPPSRWITLLGTTLPLLQKMETPAWPAALAQYLSAGRRVPE